MGQLTGVVVGGVIAFISGLTSAAVTLYFGNRREWTFRVRDERRVAYEAFLPSLDKALLFLDGIRDTTTDHMAVIRFTSGSADAEERAAFEDRLRHIADEAEKVYEEARVATDRLWLVAGTPVSAVALEPMSKLVTLKVDIERFLRGELESGEFVSVVPFYYRRDVLGRTVEAMRRDLSEPWLPHLHDRRSRRWWRFWERTPALDRA
jgi:hypothetical protein